MSEAAADQNHRSSDEEDRDHSVYSAAVHKLIVVFNAGVIGLLQLGNQSSGSVLESRPLTVLCFWVFMLIYCVLRICEIKLRVTVVRKVVGHMSHLFGALAGLLLVSLVSSVFALILLLLWLIWFSVVAHLSTRELKNLPENISGADPPNPPPA